MFLKIPLEGSKPPLKVHIENNEESDFVLYTSHRHKWPDEDNRSCKYTNPKKLCLKGKLGENKFTHDALYLGVYSSEGAHITIYYSFFLERMKIRPDPGKLPKANIVKKIEPKSIQQKYNRLMDEVIGDYDLLEELRLNIHKIKRQRILNCKKHLKARKQNDTLESSMMT